MKQVLENYGGIVVAIAVLGGILLFFGGLVYGSGSAGSAIGILANESIDRSEFYQSEGVAFLQYKERKLPEICFMEDYEIKTGIYIPVEACFQAKSHEGEELPVEVTNIISIQEESLGTVLHDGKQCFYFEVPGVYQVFVKATDKENKTAYAMVKVPVNKGESN